MLAGGGVVVAAEPVPVFSEPVFPWFAFEFPRRDSSRAVVSESFALMRSEIRLVVRLAVFPFLPPGTTIF